jgi:hypothetical protein
MVAWGIVMTMFTLLGMLILLVAAVRMPATVDAATLETPDRPYAPMFAAENAHELRKAA